MEIEGPLAPWANHQDIQAPKPLRQRDNNRPRPGTRVFLQIGQLIERDGDLCHYCGCGFSDERPRSRDHVIPRSFGGRDTLENLVLACGPCNTSRGVRPYHQFKQAMDLWLAGKGPDPRRVRYTPAVPPPRPAPVLGTTIDCLIDRDGDYCHYCRCTFDDGRQRSRHRMTPKRLGGSRDLENLVLACDACDVGRGLMPYGTFKGLMAAFLDHGGDDPRGDWWPKRLRKPSRCKRCRSMRAAGFAGCSLHFASGLLPGEPKRTLGGLASVAARNDGAESACDQCRRMRKWGFAGCSDHYEVWFNPGKRREQDTV